MSNRAFRFTQPSLSKIDRFHLRTVERRHSFKELLRKFYRIKVLEGAKFAPTFPAEIAGVAAACCEERN